MEEEIKEREGQPTPAPEETPEDLNSSEDLPQKPEETSEEEGAGDSLSEQKTTSESLQEELNKKNTQILQAEHVIENLKKKVKALGGTLDEEPVTLDKVKEVIQENFDDFRKIVGSEVAKQIKEAVATMISRQGRSKGSGSSGHPSPAPEIPMPPLSPDDKAYIARSGVKWDGKRGGWITKSGRFVPYNPKEGLPGVVK